MSPKLRFATREPKAFLGSRFQRPLWMSVVLTHARLRSSSSCERRKYEKLLVRDRASRAAATPEITRPIKTTTIMSMPAWMFGSVASQSAIPARPTARKSAQPTRVKLQVDFHKPGIVPPFPASRRVP